MSAAAALTCVAPSSAAWAPGPPKGPSPPVSGTSTPTFSSPTSPPPLSSSPHPAAMPPTPRAPTASSDAIVRRRIIRALSHPVRPVGPQGRQPILGKPASPPHESGGPASGTRTRRAALAAAARLLRGAGGARGAERDEHDATALHLVAVDGSGAVVATCRLVRRGSATVLGRMAVERSHRGRGRGRAAAGGGARRGRAAGAREVEPHAQIEVREFYARAAISPRARSSRRRASRTSSCAGHCPDGRRHGHRDPDDDQERRIAPGGGGRRRRRRRARRSSGPRRPRRSGRR